MMMSMSTIASRIALHADIEGGHIACLEGPDPGPALLLIHGQTADKHNCAPACGRRKKGTNYDRR